MNFPLLRILKPKLYVRLHKASETENLRVFTFRDPVNKFAQSAIVTKDTPWDAVAEIWDKIHETWSDELKRRDE